MIEYAKAIVRVNNLTAFTVINLIERVGTMFLIEMESIMQTNLICMTYMFRINRLVASATPAVVSLA